MTISFSRRSMLVAATVLLTRSSAFAEDSKLSESVLADLVATIDKKRQAVKTMRASFVQERTLGLLAAKVRSTGRFEIDRVRNVLEWSVAPPDEMTYRMTSEGLSYKGPHGEGRAGASTPKLGNALLDLRALLSGSLADLRKRYTLSAQRVSEGANLLTEIRAEALDPANAAIGVFSITFGSDLTKPLRARLVESRKDFTEITFSDVVLG